METVSPMDGQAADNNQGPVSSASSSSSTQHTRFSEQFQQGNNLQSCESVQSSESLPNQLPSSSPFMCASQISPPLLIYSDDSSGSGVVSKLCDGFGFVNNEIYFDYSSVRGRMPKLGETVMMECEFKEFNNLCRWVATTLTVLPFTSLTSISFADADISNPRGAQVCVDSIPETDCTDTIRKSSSGSSIATNDVQSPLIGRAMNSPDLPNLCHESLPLHPESTRFISPEISNRSRLNIGRASSPSERIPNPAMHLANFEEIKHENEKLKLYLKEQEKQMLILLKEKMEKEELEKKRLDAKIEDLEQRIQIERSAFLDKEKHYQTEIEKLKSEMTKAKVQSENELKIRDEIQASLKEERDRAESTLTDCLIEITEQNRKQCKFDNESKQWQTEIQRLKMIESEVTEKLQLESRNSIEREKRLKEALEQKESVLHDLKTSQKEVADLLKVQKDKKEVDQRIEIERSVFLEKEKDYKTEVEKLKKEMAEMKLHSGNEIRSRDEIQANLVGERNKIKNALTVCLNEITELNCKQHEFDNRSKQLQAEIERLKLFESVAMKKFQIELMNNNERELKLKEVMEQKAALEHDLKICRKEVVDLLKVQRVDQKYASCDADTKMSDPDACLKLQLKIKCLFENVLKALDSEKQKLLPELKNCCAKIEALKKKHLPVHYHHKTVRMRRIRTSLERENNTRIEVKAKLNKIEEQYQTTVDDLDTCRKEIENLMRKNLGCDAVILKCEIVESDPPQLHNHEAGTVLEPEKKQKNVIQINLKEEINQNQKTGPKSEHFHKEILEQKEKLRDKQEETETLYKTQFEQSVNKDCNTKELLDHTATSSKKDIRIMGAVNSAKGRHDECERRPHQAVEPVSPRRNLTVSEFRYKEAEHKANMAESRFQKAESRMRKADCNAEYLRRKLNMADSKIKQIEIEATEMRRKLIVAKKLTDEFKSELRDTKSRLAAAEIRTTTTEMHADDIECELNMAKKHKKELENQVIDLESRLTDAKNQITRTDTQSEEMKFKFDEADKLRLEFENRVKDTEELLKSAESRIAKSESQAEELKTKFTEAHCQAEELQNAISDSNSRLAESEIRATIAENEAGEFKRKLVEAANRSAEFEKQVQDAECKLEDAANQTELLKGELTEAANQVKIAECKAKAVNSTHVVAEKRAKQAEAQIITLRCAISDLERRRTLAEAQAGEAQCKLIQETGKTNQALSDADGLRSRLESAGNQTKQALQNNHGLKVRVREAEYQSQQACRRVEEIKASLVDANNSIEQANSDSEFLKSLLHITEMRMMQAEMETEDLRSKLCDAEHRKISERRNRHAKHVAGESRNGQMNAENGFRKVKHSDTETKRRVRSNSHSKRTEHSSGKLSFGVRCRVADSKYQRNVSETKPKGIKSQPETKKSKQACRRIASGGKQSVELEAADINPRTMVPEVDAIYKETNSNEYDNSRSIDDTIGDDVIQQQQPTLQDIETIIAARIPDEVDLLFKEGKGVVSALSETSGFINNILYFDFSAVDGRMPTVGDDIVVGVHYDRSRAIPWMAVKVQLNSLQLACSNDLSRCERHTKEQHPNINLKERSTRNSNSCWDMQNQHSRVFNGRDGEGYYEPFRKRRKLSQRTLRGEL